MAFDPSDGYVYVVNNGSHNVTVINGTKVVGSVSVGTQPVYAVYDPADAEVYVVNTASSSVSVLHGTTLAGTVTVGSDPLMATYDPADGDVYVPNSGFNSMTVSVLNGTSLAASVNVTYYNPAFSVYDAADQCVYVGNQGTSAQVVDVINGTTVAGFVPAGGTPPETPAYEASTHDVILPLDGASSGGTDHVVVVRNLTAEGSVAVGTQPWGAVYDPADGWVYVINSGSGNLTVLNGTKLVGTVSVGGSPVAATYDPSSRGIYVLSTGGGGVSLVSGTTVAATFDVGAGPQAAAYDPQNGYLYVANGASDNVSALPTWNSLTFTETGLLNGTDWSVTVNGTERSSSGSAIVFSEPNGNFSYQVTAVAGYTATGLSGNATVNGSAVTERIVFVGWGSLQVAATPASALVTLNGTPMSGAAGSYSAVLHAGPYYVNATLSGYSPYSNLVTVLPGGTTELTIDLAPVATYGTLNGTVTPATAVVIANGVAVPVASGAFNVSLTAGPYYLSVTATGYTSLVTTVNVTVGHTTTVHLVLRAVSSTVNLSGTVVPADASVVVGGFTAYVNATGYYHVSVVPGTYDVSVTAAGYFGAESNVTLTASLTANFTLAKEPTTSTSTKSAHNVSVTGYNVTVTNLSRGNGSISVTFNSTPGGTLVVSTPFADVANVTLAQLLSSRVYLNGVRYTDFAITVTTNYTVTLTVRGLDGDPTLFWALSPKTPAPPAAGATSRFLGLPGDEGYYALAGVAVAVLAVGVVVLLRHRPRMPAPRGIPAQAVSPAPMTDASPKETLAGGPRN